MTSIVYTTIANKVLHALERADTGSLRLEMPDGRVWTFSGTKAGVMAHLRINDPRVWLNLALRGDVGLAEDYRRGLWDSDDLAILFEYALQNEHCLRGHFIGGWFGRAWARLRYWLTRNTKAGSSRNIHAHYDLGNDFYALWLDPTMSYSSALFANPLDSLETAQNQKYDRILGRIGKTSQDILEIGCGWGGFMERGVTHADHRVRGITISSAQYDYSSCRMQSYSDQAAVVKQDYRDVRGQYDGIVSIEMFEAVGEQYWKTYFDKVKSLLKAKGKVVVQTITIANDAFDRYRVEGDPIRTYIFPGGMLPSPNRFREKAARAGLRVTDQYCFGQDYARTLTHWLERFDAQIDAVRAQGFDMGFVRLWRFYLAYCMAGFRSQRVDVMQAELQHI